MASSRARLLLVDDEPAIREVTSALLAWEGYDVSTAEDGVEAMGQLVEPLPDLVISDLRMPRMSGFELLTLVRERFPHVPVIAMSGEFSEKELPGYSLTRSYKRDLSPFTSCARRSLS